MSDSDSDSSFSDVGSLSDAEPVEHTSAEEESSGVVVAASGAGSSPVEPSVDGEEEHLIEDRDWFAVLKGVFESASLSTANEERFLAVLKDQEYTSGDYIVKQGSEGDSFFIIVEGDAVVREDAKKPGDQPRDLVTLHSGAHFGEFSLLRSQPRVASVVAVDTVRCKVMNKADFEAIMQDEPKFKEIITGLVEETERTRKKRELVRSKAGTRKKVYVTGNPKLKVTDTVTHSKDEQGLRRLNNYVLRRKLGQGSFGTVWLGQDTTADEGAALEDTFVAIKALDKLRLRKKRLGITDEELMREVAVMKLLRHENIVSLIEVMEDKDPTSNRDILYMVQEFMANGSIMEEEEYQDPLDPEVARQYFRDVLKGLEYLHFQRVSHRDIKPSNVLINNDKENPQAKLADFGVAAVLPDDSNMLRDPQGTPAYMAPELFDDAAEHGYDGFQADVYSLGATLFNLVVGRPPFLANSQAELSKMVEEQGVSIPAKVSSHSLRHLLRAMLEKDPKKRLTLSQIMQHDWVTVEGSEPIAGTNYVRVTKAAGAGAAGGGAGGGPGILRRLDSSSKSIASKMASGAGRVVRGSRRTRRSSLHRSDATKGGIDAAVAAAQAAAAAEASGGTTAAAGKAGGGEGGGATPVPRIIGIGKSKSNRKLSEQARQAQQSHLETLRRKRFQLLASLDLSDQDKDQMLEHQRLPIHGSRAHVTIEEIVIDDSPAKVEASGAYSSAAEAAPAEGSMRAAAMAAHDGGAGPAGEDSPMPGQKLPGASFLFRQASLRPREESESPTNEGDARVRTASGSGSVLSRGMSNYEGRRLMVSNRTQSSVDLGAALYGYAGSVVSQDRHGHYGSQASQAGQSRRDGSVSGSTSGGLRRGFPSRYTSMGSEGGTEDQFGPLLGADIAGNALVTALSRSRSMRYMFGSVMQASRPRSNSSSGSSEAEKSHSGMLPTIAAAGAALGGASTQGSMGVRTYAQRRKRGRQIGTHERRHSAPPTVMLEPSALALLLAAENGLAIGRPKPRHPEPVVLPKSKIPFQAGASDGESSATKGLLASGSQSSDGASAPRSLPQPPGIRVPRRASRPWMRAQPAFVMAPLARAPSLIENEWISSITPMAHETRSPKLGSTADTGPVVGAAGPLPPPLRAEETAPMSDGDSGSRLHTDRSTGLDKILEGIGGVQEVDEVHGVDDDGRENSDYGDVHSLSRDRDDDTGNSGASQGSGGEQPVQSLREAGDTVAVGVAPRTRAGSKDGKGSLVGTKSLANIMHASKGELLRDGASEAVGTVESFSQGSKPTSAATAVTEAQTAGSNVPTHVSGGSGISSGLRRSGSMPGQSGAGNAAVVRASMAMARQMSSKPVAPPPLPPSVSRVATPGKSESPAGDLRGSGVARRGHGDTGSVWTTAVRHLPRHVRMGIRRRSMGMPPLPMLRMKEASNHGSRSIRTQGSSAAAGGARLLPPAGAPHLPPRGGPQGVSGDSSQSGDTGSVSSSSHPAGSLSRTGSLRDAPPGTSFKGRTLTRQADFLMVTENVGTTAAGETVKKAVIFRSKGDTGLSIATTNMDKKTLERAKSKASKRSLLSSKSSQQRLSDGGSQGDMLDSGRPSPGGVVAVDSGSDSDDLGLDGEVVQLVKTGEASSGSAEDGGAKDLTEEDVGRGLTRMGSRSKQALRMRINPTVTEGEAEDISSEDSDSDYSDLMEEETGDGEATGELKDVTDMLDDVLGLNEEAVVKVDDELEALSDADLDSDDDGDSKTGSDSQAQGTPRSAAVTPRLTGRRLGMFASPGSAAAGGAGSSGAAAPAAKPEAGKKYRGVDVARTHGSQTNAELQLSMASAEVQGKRSTMEDRSIALVQVGAALGDEIEASDGSAVPPAKAPTTSYFGVYDGHNGQECSQALQDELHLAVWESVRGKEDSKGVAEGLREAFLAVDDHYTAGSIEREKANRGKYMFCGSTAIVALVREEPVDEGEVYLPEEIADRRGAEEDLPEAEVKRIHLEDGRVLAPVLYVANAGDCRAVLSRAGRAIDLSEDHKPSLPEEKARIEAAGGWVHNGRLHGVLGVARAFGDAEHKHLKEKSWGKEFKSDPLVADPDVHVEAVGPRDEFLILACDGLWDVMGSQQAVNYVRQAVRKHHDLQEAAAGLVSKAIGMNSADNVSVIVVAFNQRWCAKGVFQSRSMGSSLALVEDASALDAAAAAPRQEEAGTVAASGGAGTVASSAGGAVSGDMLGGDSDSDSDDDDDDGDALEEW